MFRLGSEVARTSPDFVPAPDATRWLADILSSLAARLGAPAMAPRVITEVPANAARDFDSLFDLVCGAQAVVGQGDVEFTLVESPPNGAPEIPPGYALLGDASGQMMTTLHREADDEYAVLYNAAMFKAPELVLASVARELGRVAIHRAGGPDTTLDASDQEAEVELAAVTIGMGVWVANGAYMFENGCCGGGCGLDLKSVRAALSMPEAVWATAFDAKRRGINRRAVAKNLAPTQKAAFKKSWNAIGKTPAAALAAGSAPRAALGA